MGRISVLDQPELALSGRTMAHPPPMEMTEAIAFIFVLAIRLETIQYLFVVWAEYPLGLAYAAWRVSIERLLPAMRSPYTRRRRSCCCCW